MVRNSKILVAGGTGFIGSNLINDLITRGNSVISLSKNSTKKIIPLDNLTHIFHDLTEPFQNREIDLLSDVEYIVNCSGYIDHRSFSDGGKEVFYEHFKSLYSLTNLAIEIRAKSFIQIGSSDEYGGSKSPIKESIRESPLSPYALGKLSSTHYLEQCFRQGILNTVILRPFLVFGERQNKDRFLPYLIYNCLKNRKFKVSKGEQIKDYLYVKDFNLAVINSLNNSKAYGEVINIASGIPISIKDVIKHVHEIIGKGKPIIGSLDYRKGENMELYADIKKAKKVLNWAPKYEFRKSLEKVINWYSKNIS